MKTILFTDTWGIALLLRLDTPITGATAASVVIKAPNGRVTTRVATITDEILGYITYVTKQDDFTRVGDYEIQVIVDTITVKRFRSYVHEIDVRVGI